MALTKRGEYWYGEAQSDISTEILRYSKANTYVAQHFADATCTCGKNVFRLVLDDAEGAAVRFCVACDDEHPIGDSDEYLENADLEDRECVCGAAELEITVGVSLYADSEDVRWLYLGCRCPSCGLTGVYGDWKNEFIGYRELLARV